MSRRRPLDSPNPVRIDVSRESPERIVVACPFCSEPQHVAMEGEVDAADAEQMRCSSCRRGLLVTGESRIEAWAELAPLPPDLCGDVWHEAPPLVEVPRCPTCGMVGVDGDDTLPLFPSPASSLPS